MKQAKEANKSKAEDTTKKSKKDRNPHHVRRQIEDILIERAQRKSLEL